MLAIDQVGAGLDVTIACKQEPSNNRINVYRPSETLQEIAGASIAHHRGYRRRRPCKRRAKIGKDCEAGPNMRQGHDLNKRSLPHCEVSLAVM